MERHPGIRIDRIPVKRNLVGLLFVAGTLYIFLVGIPQLRVFVPIGLAGGLLVGISRYWVLSKQSRKD